MTGKRLLLVGEEIVPFLPETPKAIYGKELPKYANENGMLVRAFLPKWGNINERRNQLHEVIRLSGLNISINDVDHPLLIKVASLPGTKLQVYFIDNNDLFKKKLMTADENGNEYADNWTRAIFYARSTMETCKLLHWNPYIIQCQGWFASLVPFFLKNVYKDEPIFSEAKAVLIINKEKTRIPVPKNFAKMLAFRNITEEYVNSLGNKLETFADYVKLCIPFADGVILAEDDIPEEYIQIAKDHNIPLLEHSHENFVEKSFEFYKTIV